MSTRTRCVGEHGQVAVLLGALLIATGAIAVLLLAQVGGTVNDRQRARTAADAAALAGVLSGEDAAAELAARNGGTLEAFRRFGAEIEVTVRVGRARATSRAAPDVGNTGTTRRHMASRQGPRAHLGLVSDFRGKTQPDCAQIPC
jgi:hypothetical protein